MPGLRFRLAGIPIRIDLTLFLVAGFLAWGRPTDLLVQWVLVVPFSILVHELGHAVAFRAFGQRPSIVLHGLGGLTSGSGPLTRGRDIVVSLAGSGAGLAFLGLPAWYALTYGVPGGWLAPFGEHAFRVYVLLNDLVWINVVWALLNLLPLLPFDGGRVASALLEGWLGDRGRRGAVFLSIATAATGSVWGFVNGWTLAPLFGLFVIGENLSRLGADRDRGLEERISEGHRTIDAGDAAAAAQAASAIHRRARTRAIEARALELEAWAHLDRREVSRARGAVGRMQDAEPSRYLAAAIGLADSEPDARGRVADALLRSGAPPPNAVLARLIARTDLDGVLDLLSEAGEDGLVPMAVLAHQLHGSELFRQSARAGERLYEDGGLNPEIAAYNVACSLARIGVVEEAVRWLDRAIAAGFRDTALLDGDPDLATLRHLPAYGSIRERLGPSEVPPRTLG